MGPQQGTLPGLGEVGHSPRGTSGSAGILDWGPMWSGSQCTCHPNTPLHPWHFLTAPYTPRQCPMPPYATYTPSCPWVLTLLLPPYAPDTPTPLMPPNGSLHPWRAPMPYATYTLLVYEYLHSLPAPNTPWHPLHPPYGPHTLYPLGDPQCPLCYLYSWPLTTYTPCQSPYTPLTPL